MVGIESARRYRCKSEAHPFRLGKPFARADLQLLLVEDFVDNVKLVSSDVASSRGNPGLECGTGRGVFTQKGGMANLEASPKGPKSYSHTLNVTGLAV